MEEYKEGWFTKLLKKLGVIREYEVSKEEMCKAAQSICDHKCDYCAWSNEKMEE